MKYLKRFNESSDYTELDPYHNNAGYEWEQDHKGDRLSSNDIECIKHLITKLKSTKKEILVGSESQQKFSKVNPNLPYKDNPHMFQFSIVMDSQNILKVFISKFQDEWIKVDYCNRHLYEFNSGKIDWVDDHSTNKIFICDQTHGLEELIDDLITNLSK